MEASACLVGITLYTFVNLRCGMVGTRWRFAFLCEFVAGTCRTPDFDAAGVSVVFVGVSGRQKWWRRQRTPVSARSHNFLLLHLFAFIHFLLRSIASGQCSDVCWRSMCAVQ